MTAHLVTCAIRSEGQRPGGPARPGARVTATLLTLSLDAEDDTPEAVRRFVEGHGAPPGWCYLTGAPAGLETLRVFLGFRDRRPGVDRDRSQHLRMVLIGNAPADRWVGMSGLSRVALLAGAVLRSAAERRAPAG